MKNWYKLHLRLRKNERIMWISYYMKYFTNFSFSLLICMIFFFHILLLLLSVMLFSSARKKREMGRKKSWNSPRDEKWEKPKNFPVVFRICFYIFIHNIFPCFFHVNLDTRERNEFIFVFFLASHEFLLFYCVNSFFGYKKKKTYEIMIYRLINVSASRPWEAVCVRAVR